jgi:hypothetical protein
VTGRKGSASHWERRSHPQELRQGDAQNMSRFSMTFSRFPAWKRRNSLTFARVKYHKKIKWLAISVLHFKNINWTRLNGLCFHFNLKWLRINWGDSIRFGMTWKDWGKKTTCGITASQFFFVPLIVVLNHSNFSAPWASVSFWFLLTLPPTTFFFTLL